jgi:hypothetical protein
MHISARLNVAKCGRKTGVFGRYAGFHETPFLGSSPPTAQNPTNIFALPGSNIDYGPADSTRHEIVYRGT